MKAKMFHILHMHAPHSPRKLPAPPIQHHTITKRLSFRSPSIYVCSVRQENIGFKQKHTAAPTYQGFFSGCLCTLYRNSKDFSVYCLFFSFFFCLTHSDCCLAGSLRFSDKHKIATIFIFLSCILFGADTYEYPCAAEYAAHST